MENPSPRRQFLITVTSTMGIAGIGFAAVPFIASMLPSERAKALGGPVTIDIDRLEPGQALTVEWRSRPIFIVHRTKPMLARLAANASLLADPESQVESQQPPYARNVPRSIRPEILVVIGICTHLGCVPARHFEVGDASGLGDDWPGGWFCPCHGSKFDLAGRVFRNVPAPTNLVVPPYHYDTPTRLVIGVGPSSGSDAAGGRAARRDRRNFVSAA